MALPTSTLNQAQIDSVFSSVLASATEKQAGFFTGKGRYFQGLKTPAVTPADMLALPTDSILKPAGQPESWANAGIALPVLSEISFRIDVYDGPKGRGYVLHGEIQLAGKLYRKSACFGPESWQEQDWHDVTIQ